MTHDTLPTPAATPDTLPAAWQERLTPQLGANEKVTAWVETDLSTDLRFSTGLIVLTDCRLLAGDESGWQAYPLSAGLVLRLADHAGVASLALGDASRRMALWRFTLGCNTAAQRLADRFPPAGRQPCQRPAHRRSNGKPVPDLQDALAGGCGRVPHLHP